MTTDTMPTFPTLSGDTAKDSAARHEYEAQLAGYFERNPPEGQTPTAPRALTPVDQARLARERIADFDAEMRAQGVQRNDVVTGEVDQRGIDACFKWRRDNPNATREQLAVWEGDLASFYAGRRWGENLSAFYIRQAAVASGVAPPEASNDDPLADATPAERADVERLARLIDENGACDASAFSKEQLCGYTLPAGQQFDAGETIYLLKQARAAGVSQAQVDTFIRSQR